MNYGKTISLCIIAKDEESSIASCINSAKHLVSEIILVDTGSRDSTVELARQMGAMVFHFSWCDDFAAARNFSLDRAAGQWILVLDADEILEEVPPDQLQLLLNAQDVEGYFVNIHSCLGDGRGTANDQVVRLFKNRPEYRFERAIHEQVATSIKRHNNGGGLAFSGLNIRHFGYIDRQVRQKDKRRRNISVIEKALAGNPGDPFLHYSLGIEHYQSGRAAMGNRQMEKALSLMKGDEGYLRDALVFLGLGLLQEGKYGNLSTLLDKSLAILPGDPDLHFIRGVMEMQNGRYQEASAELEAAFTGSGRVTPPGQVHSLLGDALYLQGRYSEAESHYNMALKANPINLYPLTRILGIRQEGKGWTSWDDLSLFAPVPLMTRLRKELARAGEIKLAMVLALLTVVRSAGSGELENMAQNCLEYRQSLKSHLSGPETFNDFMMICAEEMVLHGNAAYQGISCDLYSPVKEVSSLARALLELTVKSPCPPWSSLPVSGNRKG
ncbi:MAG: glycosyltransferase [Bacillota bacterium]